MACRFDSRPPLGPWLVLSRGLSRRWGASTDGGHSRTGGELAGQPQLPPVGLCRRRRVRRGWHSRGLTSDQAWAGELGVMRRLRFVPRGCRCSPAPRIVPARSTRSSCRWNRGAVPPCRGGARGVCRPDHINGWLALLLSRSSPPLCHHASREESREGSAQCVEGSRQAGHSLFVHDRVHATEA